MLKALPSVFVNRTAQIILPNRIASGDAPTIVIGAVCASATSSTAVQPANSALAPNLAHHTGQSSFRPENIGSETLKPAPTSCCTRAPVVSAIPESTLWLPSLGFPSCYSTDHMLRYHVKEKHCNNCVQCTVCFLCLSLDGDMQKCHAIMRRGDEISVQQTTLTRNVCKYDEGRTTFRSQHAAQAS